MRRITLRLLAGAALAVTAAAPSVAELVRPGIAEEGGVLELESGTASALDTARSPGAEPLTAETAPSASLENVVASHPRRYAESSAQAFLRELYHADRDQGLDGFLAEMRANALAALGAPSSAEARPAACPPGSSCATDPATRRAERSAEDRELIATLSGIRADVRELVSPLASVYQDSGIKTLLEALRSDDLIFGQDRSAHDAGRDRNPVDLPAEPRGRAGESREEVLALFRFARESWQIMRDYGIPLILLMILIRGFMWVARARRA